jgi:hypothetical protein
MVENLANLNTGEGDIPFHKRQEFVLFRFWRSLPAFFKNQPEALLREKLGIDDEEMIELLKTKNQKQFSEKYAVSEVTLSKWNKYIDEHYDPFDEVKAWSRKLIRNVISATYNSSLQRDPKANADRKLFLQLQGWVEETKQVHKVENFTDLIKSALNGSGKGSAGSAGTGASPAGSGVVPEGDSGNGAVGEATGDNQLG